MSVCRTQQMNAVPGSSLWKWLFANNSTELICTAHAHRVQIVLGGLLSSTAPLPQGLPTNFTGTSSSSLSPPLSPTLCALRPCNFSATSIDAVFLTHSGLPAACMLCCVLEQVSFATMVYNIYFAYGFDGVSYSLPNIAHPSPADRLRLRSLLNSTTRIISLSRTHPTNMRARRVAAS